MTNSIQRGFRGKLGQYLNDSKDLTIQISIDGDANYDTCCFGLDAQEKLSDDRYMVFYNQKASPNNEITQNDSGKNSSYTFNLSKLPASVNKLAFTISVDGEGVMSQVRRLTVSLAEKKGKLSSLFSAKDAALSLELAGTDFSNEKALIAIEIYRKDEWRLSAVASGFDGGLAALLHHYGGEVAEATPPQPAPKVEETPSPSSPVSSKVSLEKRLKDEAPELLSLAKPLSVCLKKNKLTDTVARVALVLDISGSMIYRYQDGAVQDVVNKTVPLAVQFDDDGELDLWYFGGWCQRMDSINTGNYKNGVPDNWQQLMTNLGGYNNEPVVMTEVINEYSGSELPAYVLFITDGGVSQESEIKQLLIEASRLPIFWQFVGLGGSGYGVLERLDTMKGRYVDNANFFALDDFRSVSDTELYDRLLNEFPDWLKKAKSKRIL
ncbi:MAG: VWA domain-containing protein [Deltaproteobacteria bacterium]|jgi:stress response protein SCP2|nr:VWA domain-containing protein [Deltaproteobacteria bacterium]